MNAWVDDQTRSIHIRDVQTLFICGQLLYAGHGPREADHLDQRIDSYFADLRHTVVAQVILHAHRAS